MNTRRNFIKKSFLGLAIGTSGLVEASAQQKTSAQQKPPLRPRQGKSVMGFRCDPIPTVRIGIIGLGRGRGFVNELAHIEGTHIVAVSDLVPNRIETAQNYLKNAGRPEAVVYTGDEEAWKKMCERDDIDLIYSVTPWQLHVPTALYAMRHGKHVVIEVPAALTVDDCWALVDTAEITKRHCMMLENCCYDFFELATLNMVRNDVFGEIYHSDCAYLHDQRSLQFNKNNYPHPYMWRLQYIKEQTGNPYPTHGLGPVAQIMDINRGDRFDYLTSMSTNQYGYTLYAENNFGKDSPEAKASYILGDVNTTLLHTMNGHTIMLQHDITSPRPYDRIHKIVGTKGCAVKYPEEKIALEPASHEYLKPDEFNALMAKYEHPISKYIGEKAKTLGGHGGMDYIMHWRLVYCLRNGLPLDKDVYDAAAWSCIVELSEQSVLNRSCILDIPDFTRGEWKNAKPWPVIDMVNVFA